MIGGGPVSPNPGPAWKAVGTGDFNDDGHSDILFQNTSSGQVSIWEMNGNTLIGGGPVSANPGPAWHAIGTGDFNHDGLSDILFQNASTGQVSIWEMNGNNLIGGGPVSPNPGTSWHAIGTDGGSDILFQNTSGQASIWDMSGNQPGRRRTGHPQSWAKLASRRPDLTCCNFSASASIAERNECAVSENAGFERRRVRPERGGETAGVDMVGPVPLEAHLDQFARERRKHCACAQHPGRHGADTKLHPERLSRDCKDVPRGARRRGGNMPGLTESGIGVPARSVVTARAMSGT